MWGDRGISYPFLRRHLDFEEGGDDSLHCNLFASIRPPFLSSDLPPVALTSQYASPALLISPSHIHSRNLSLSVAC